MKDCQSFHKLIGDLLAGVIEAGDREKLDEHCLSCGDCRERVELHEELAAIGEESIPEPPASAFEAVRGQVLNEIISRSRPAGSFGGWGWWRDLRDLFRIHPLAAPVMVTSLLVAALFLGRWSAGTGVGEPPADPFLQGIEQLTSLQATDFQTTDFQAAGTNGINSIWDAPYQLTNVSVRPNDDGSMALSFDLCRHVDLVAPRESALVREVLLHAILDSPTLGGRLKAMTVAPQLRDPRLEEALVYTLHNDPNQTVRLKAMTMLTQHTFDHTVQEALLATLKEDPAVQLRLMALETLSSQTVDPDVIWQAIESSGQESNPAVMQYAVELADRL